MNFLELIKNKKINPNWLNSNRITVECVDDVYKAAGRILQASQEWEHEFQVLCRLRNIELNNNFSFSSLTAASKQLFAAKFITKDECNQLNNVIYVINEFEHKYFLYSLFFGAWDSQFKKVSETLTNMLFIIDESSDWLDNKIGNV